MDAIDDSNASLDVYRQVMSMCYHRWFLGNDDLYLNGWR
jgi:hypothetical protein